MWYILTIHFAFNFHKLWGHQSFEWEEWLIEFVVSKIDPHCKSFSSAFCQKEQDHVAKLDETKMPG